MSVLRPLARPWVDTLLRLSAGAVDVRRVWKKQLPQSRFVFHKLAVRVIRLDRILFIVPHQRLLFFQYGRDVGSNRSDIVLTHVSSVGLEQRSRHQDMIEIYSTVLVLAARPGNPNGMALVGGNALFVRQVWVQRPHARLTSEIVNVFRRAWAVAPKIIHIALDAVV